MPVVTLSVPQSSETVSRYVLRGVVTDLMNAVEFKPDTDIIIQEDIGAPPTTGGTIDGTPSVKLTHDNHVIVKNTETYREEDIVTSVVHKEEYPYIFMDRDVGIYIRPTYAIVKNSVSVTLNFRDKSAGDRFKRLLRLRGGIRTLTNKHDIRYEYSLPDDILAFLYDAHSMLEIDSTGNKDNLATYLSKNFRGGLGRRTTQSGGHSRLVIDEVQGNIIGTYPDEIFYNDLSFDDGHYSLEFTYEFNYNMILGVVMEYPNVIHNRRIPKEYRKAWLPPEIKDTQDSTLVHKTLSYMPPLWKAKIGRFYRGEGGFKIDPTDEWEPKNKTPNTMPIVLAPILVDTSDPTLLLSIWDFTDEQLPLDIKEYIMEFPIESFILHACPYHIQAYEVDNKELETTISLYPDGTIRSAAPMSTKKRHYIRISFMTDMGKIPFNHMASMLSNPERTLKMLRHLHPSIDTESGDWLKVVGNKQITANSMRSTIKRMPTTNDTYARIKENHPKYNSTTNIIAKR
jgi:hypothetical protein